MENGRLQRTINKVRKHHSSAFRSTVFTGGSEVIGLFASILRSKFAALYLGVGGISIFSLLTQLATLVTTLTDFGVTTSGVRQIASAHGSTDEQEVSRVARSLRLLAWVTATVGATLTVLLSNTIGRITFGTDEYNTQILYIGGAIFVAQISAGQSALLAGLGKVRELAMQRVIVAVLGTVLVVPLYSLFGAAAIGPAILGLGLLTLVGSWWQSRQIPLQPVDLKLGLVIEKAWPIVLNGLPILWSSLAFLGASYFVGIMVQDTSGLHGSGLYQAAWAISGYLVGFVLTATSQDFFPRLSAHVHDRAVAADLVNAQIEIGVLVSLPSMLLFSACGRWTVPALLSQDFISCIEIMQVLCLGSFGRIVNWPMLFVLNAAKKSTQHVAAVTFAAAMYVVFAWLGLRAFGAIGAALGFAMMHFVHFVWMRITVGRLIGFAYTRDAALLIAIGAVLLALAPLMNPWAGLAIGLISAHFCVRSLCGKLGPNHRLVDFVSRTPVLGRIYVRH